MWSCLTSTANRLHSRERGSLSYRVKHGGDGHETVKDNHSMRRPQRVQHNSTAPQRSVTQTLSGLLHRKCEIKQPRHLDLTPAVRSRCLGCFSIRNAACGLAETGATQHIKFMTAETPPLLDFQYSVRTLTRSLICNKKKVFALRRPLERHAAGHQQKKCPLVEWLPLPHSLALSFILKPFEWDKRHRYWHC